ncbi:hypothetical protein FPQ14_00300 [Gilliamella apicola]|uniref:Uncharacterized protein n=1 Tax=Gilliamella apicola TaxID=1196095 RepID=A0A556RS64_9GAMM|nr:hypothetical protein [Gilliamella apicola]TSJ91746.1 hypothetical protein FPQ14_00300 [Gilliamella apicola]
MWCDKTFSLAKYQSMNYEAIVIEPYKQTNDKFLSPSEAITALKTKIDSSNHVAVIMISSLTETDFINQLTALANCWDLPEIKRALRTAKTVQDLDTTKMIIPSPTDRKNVKQLSSGNTRAIVNSQTLAAAQMDSPASISGVMKQLEKFAGQKKSALNEITKNVQGLTGGSIDIKFYYGLPADLKKELPNCEHIFTFLLAFSDENLTPILDLVHDRKLNNRI